VLTRGEGKNRKANKSNWKLAKKGGDEIEVGRTTDPLVGTGEKGSFLPPSHRQEGRPAQWDPGGGEKRRPLQEFQRPEGPWDLEKGPTPPLKTEEKQKKGVHDLCGP